MIKKKLAIKMMCVERKRLKVAKQKMGLSTTDAARTQLYCQLLSFFSIRFSCYEFYLKTARFIQM